jgi:hypothetical protein
LGRSKPEFGSVFQIGVPSPNNSVSPLSLRERARVRGFLLLLENGELSGIQNFL